MGRAHKKMAFTKTRWLDIQAKTLTSLDTSKDHEM